MTRIIAVANQKGGVGKTTTTVNLAASLAAMKRRVLLVDLDPQGNATTGAGVDKRACTATVYHVLLGEKSIADARIASSSGGFDLVPANRELAGAEVELVELPERETRLKDALADALQQMRSAISSVARDYDFILLDCPPSLSLLTLNGLCAADSVLIPMQCEYYALEGLSDLVQTVKKVRAHLNPRLEIEGLLRTMFDPAQHARAQCLRRAREAFRRQGLPHGDPAQHPARRSAVARHPCAAPRQEFEGRARVPGARRRDAAADGGGRRRRFARRGAVGLIGATQPRTASMIRPKGLGRGLDALLAGVDNADATDALQAIAIERVQPGKYQPRTQMNDAALDELAASIREHGVMQPILVRPDRRRALRDRRRRTALARGEARGTRGGPRARQSGARSIGACVGAHREHPARGPEPARAGERAPAADRRIRHDARRRGEGGRPLAQRGDEPAAPARAREAGAGVPDARTDRHGTRARAARARRAASRPRQRPASSRRDYRCAKRSGSSINSRTRAGATRSAARPRPMPISRACRRSSPMPSARRSRSCRRPTAPASSSSATRASISSTASSRSSSAVASPRPPHAAASSCGYVVGRER